MRRYICTYNESQWFWVKTCMKKLFYVREYYENFCFPVFRWYVLRIMHTLNKFDENLSKLSNLPLWKLNSSNAVEFSLYIVQILFYSENFHTSCVIGNFTQLYLECTWFQQTQQFTLNLIYSITLFLWVSCSNLFLNQKKAIWRCQYQTLKPWRLDFWFLNFHQK